MGMEPAELHEEKPEIRYARYKAVRLNNSIARQNMSSPGALGFFISFSLITFDTPRLGMLAGKQQWKTRMAVKKRGERLRIPADAGIFFF
jgi:hypothetical protein